VLAILSRCPSRTLHGLLVTKIYFIARLSTPFMYFYVKKSPSGEKEKPPGQVTLGKTEQNQGWGETKLF